MNALSQREYQKEVGMSQDHQEQAHAKDNKSSLPLSIVIIVLLNS